MLCDFPIDAFSKYNSTVILHCVSNQSGLFINYESLFDIFAKALMSLFGQEVSDIHRPLAKEIKLGKQRRVQ
jgi:hypothetical protein